MLRSVNPSTGEQIATYDEHTAEEVESQIDRAVGARPAWATLRFDDRAEILRRAADLLDERAGDLAALMADEMGKPVAEGRSEAQKCAWVCRYYADNAAAHLADIPIDADRTRSYVHHVPLGVVLAVMPWNFPFWQVFRFAAPGLMAGNVALLKHASNVTGCAVEIERLLADAGLPEGCFTTLRIGSDAVESVLEHDAVRAVTLTGSGPAGRAVAAVAGRLLKKSVLELGGSDPYLVLADADLDHAVETCATSRLINSGQSCIAAKRFIAVDDVHDRFVERFVDRMSSVVAGDPHDDTSDIGPQARADLRDELHDQVTRSVEAGARCLVGGEVPAGPGAFYPATVLVDVEPGMPAADEELFGPVAAVLRARDEDHAVELANTTRFGLGAAVFTTDVDRGERIAADRLDAGCCFVNDYVASDPRLPFGGVKDSGYGRELSDLGIREFVNRKTVAVGPRST